MTRVTFVLSDIFQEWHLSRVAFSRVTFVKSKMEIKFKSKTHWTLIHSFVQSQTRNGKADPVFQLSIFFRVYFKLTMLYNAD